MADAVESLILDLLEWVGRKERTYRETMDAWRTSCPKLPVWEDANDRGLVEMASSSGSLLVRATPAGLALLKEKRPRSIKHGQPSDMDSNPASAPTRTDSQADRPL
jgi:hypothetical protein